MPRPRKKIEPRPEWPGWKNRLLEALENDGRHWNQICLAAGLSPGFLNSIYRVGREPGIDKVEAICKVLNIGLPEITAGSPLNAENEKRWREFREMPEEDREVLANLMARFRQK